MSPNGNHENRGWFREFLEHTALLLVASVIAAFEFGVRFLNEKTLHLPEISLLVDSFVLASVFLACFTLISGLIECLLWEVRSRWQCEQEHSFGIGACGSFRHYRVFLCPGNVSFP
jgi:hypothetical protein